MTKNDPNHIPEKEYKIRAEKFQSLFNEPYRKALIIRQTEIFDNPEYKEWRNESGLQVYGMKPEYQQEWDSINKEIDQFRKNMYPELVFNLEDEEKQMEVKKLKENEEYKKLIKGINYHSIDIQNDSSALTKISDLNKQITDLIDKQYPNLFSF